MWYAITELKKELVKNLRPYFREKDFIFKSGFNGGSIGFKEKSNNQYFFIWFGLFSSGKIIVNPFCGYYGEIEELIFKIRLPNKSIPFYYEKAFDPLSHVTIIEDNNDKSIIESGTIYTKRDVESLCVKVRMYFEERCKPFMEENDSIEKIYEQLIVNWKRGNLSPLILRTDQYFKATVILKLMGDDNIGKYQIDFRKRLSMIQNADKWLKSYEELCSMLNV